MFQFQNRNHSLPIRIATFVLNVLPSTRNEEEPESYYISFDVLEDVFELLVVPRASAAEKTLIEYFTTPQCNVKSSKLLFSYPAQSIMELQFPSSSLPEKKKNKAWFILYCYSDEDGSARVCASYRTAPVLPDSSSTEDASAFVVDERGTIHGVSTGWESNAFDGTQDAAWFPSWHVMTLDTAPLESRSTVLLKRVETEHYGTFRVIGYSPSKAPRRNVNDILSLELWELLLCEDDTNLCKYKAFRNENRSFRKKERNLKSGQHQNMKEKCSKGRDCVIS
eukprot:PhM_4_TR3411/c4_g2_i6/m.82455